ncbi:MAG: hypothetical protein V4471_00620 [Pseudomonadota bacterium]
MNEHRIEALKREIDELRRRLDIADAEVKNIDRRFANAQRTVSRLEHNPANREKAEEIKRELQNYYQQDYDSASRNYYSIFSEIHRKNIELMQEKRINMNLEKSFRR